MEQEKSQMVTKFLETVVADRDRDIVTRVGRNQVIRKDRGLKNIENTVLGINIVGTYFAFPDTTLESIGNVYGISRERVRQLVEDTLLDLWNLSSPEVQSKFPLRKLYEGKTNKLRGANLQAFTMIQEGKTAREIYQKLGVDSTKFSQVRSILSKRNVNLEYLSYESERLAKEIEGSQSDEETSKLLSKIDRNMHANMTRLGDRPITTLKDLATQSGFFFSNRDLKIFLEVLKEANFPLGIVNRKVPLGKGKFVEQNYYFIASKDLRRGVSILRESDTLHKFKTSPIRKITGEWSDEVPSTWQLTGSGEYKTVGSLLRRFGIHLPRLSIESKRLLMGEDCEVEVFAYKGGYFFSIKDEDKLINHFKSKFPLLKR